MSLRTLIKTALRRVGYGIYAIPRGVSELRAGYAYAEACPSATLAPWLSDREFMATFARIKENTLVDIYRLYELWSLVQQTALIGGDIVEVGVWRGGSGALLAHRQQLLGRGGRTFLCDTFSGVVKAGAADSSYHGGEHRDTGVSYVQAMIDHFDLRNVEILTGVFPDATGPALDSARVCLLHIDVDVYQSAKDSVRYLWDRMPPGAAIVFDDYGFVGCEGVTRYVDELRGAAEVFFFHNLNGHAVVLKR